MTLETSVYFFVSSSDFLLIIFCEKIELLGWFLLVTLVLFFFLHVLKRKALIWLQVRAADRSFQSPNNAWNQGTKSKSVEEEMLKMQSKNKTEKEGRSLSHFFFAFFVSGNVTPISDKMDKLWALTGMLQKHRPYSQTRTADSKVSVKEEVLQCNNLYIAI